VIEFRNTSKTYRPLFGRTVHAVEDFSLQIAEGEILGIAGPNGAGKSTLIALLLGYLRPTSGSITINGLAPRTYVETYGVGYVSELVNIHPRWRTSNALVRYAVLAGIPRHEVHDRVDAVIEQLGIGEHRDKKVKALSKGNAQRLGLAQALLRDEQVLVFDEPTHGLDPLWTQRFRDIVQDLRSPGRTILVASHNLDELQRIADRVAIIDHGRLQRLVSTGYEPAPDSVLTYRLRLAIGADVIRDVFGAADEVGKGEFEISVRDLSELNRGLATLIARGALIAGVAPSRSVLEEQFRAVVGEKS
jgi:ABC-type multidrug transport system ATPase subunit